jgi:predicted aldo/keto reductase-like oxidoreductase
MDYRNLGKTGFKVSTIGLGVEYLKTASVQDVTQIFCRGFEEGLNYIDLVWSYPNIIEGLKEALNKTASKPVIAFHLGSCLKDGKYKRSRNPAECEAHLKKLLVNLGLKSAPIVNIHYAANLDIWQEVNRKGIVTLAQKLKAEGTAKAVGLSTHEPEVVKLAAESGVIDSVMIQINVANPFHPLRDEALLLCRDLGVGVVAMKPLVGGELLKVGKKVKIAAYKTGWKSMTVNVPQGSSPAKLLNYARCQPGVCTAVMGVASLEELDANLQLFKTPDIEKDYHMLIESIRSAE